MSNAVDAAQDILRSTRPPVYAWREEEEIRETASSSVDVPSRQEVLLENLDTIRESDEMDDSEVGELINFVDEWPDEQLEEIRFRLQCMARQLLNEEGDASR